MGGEPWAAHLPEPGHTWLPEPWSDRGLGSVWSERWAEDPSALLVHAEGRWWTRADIEQASAEVAGAYFESGLGAGDRVLISAASSVELVLSYVGAIRAGLVVVPAHTGYTARELEHLVADAEPALAVLDEPERLSDVAPALPVLAPGHRRVGSRADRLDRAAGDELALLPYTSGTTGRPKGVPLTHDNLVAGAASVLTAWRWTSADRLLLCLPLFHMHGLGVGLNGTLLAGASAVIQSGFDPDRVLDAVSEHAATLFFGVPTMYQRLVDHPRVGELSELRLCVSGSAPLPAELHRAMSDLTGQRVLERYGMTETVMNLSNPYEGDRRPGSVGLPLPGVEARIAGGLSEGEVEVRGPNVFGGYWRRPEDSAQAFTPDGWFRTGDIGTRDPDGWWRIVGRGTELIISGGYNVYPREVEDVLIEHPAVDQAGVAGVPDPEWGEQVMALVVPAVESLDLDELAAFAAERLVNYKRPRRLLLVDSLPRNAMGKLVRPELASLALELVGSANGLGDQDA